MVRFYKTPDYHGSIDGTGKLTKKGKQVVLFKIYDGFGVAVKILNKVKVVEVHYKDEVYIARTSLFTDYGIPHKYHDEAQLILPRKYWLVASQVKLF